MVSLKLEGADKLLKELKDLGGNVKRSVRAACKAGGQVIQAEADVLAPAVRYARKTVVKASFPRPEVCEVSIGPAKKTWYLRFSETGATAHEIAAATRALAFEGRDGLVVTKGVRHPGMAARPFLRPAFDARSDAAAARVGEVLRGAVEERRAIVAGADEE